MRFLLVALLASLCYAQTGGCRGEHRISESWSWLACVGPNRYTCDDGEACCCKPGTAWQDGECQYCGCRVDEPYPGSNNWLTCTGDSNLYTCGDHCCCRSYHGRDYTPHIEQGKFCTACWDGRVNCRRDEQIISGSENWSSCNHANTYTCEMGNQCCCLPLYEADSNGYCVPCGTADPIATGRCADDEAIDGSNSWWWSCSSYDDNLYNCNGYCCCPTSYTWNADTEVCERCAPVDCVMSIWNAGACSVTCGQGSQTETRGVITEGAHGGTECPSDRSRTVTCGTSACPPDPVDCVMNEWQNSGECSVTCGTGTQTQTRDSRIEPVGTGEACPTDTTRTVTCTRSACSTPVACADNDAGAVEYAREMYGFTIRDCRPVRRYCNNRRYRDAAREFCPQTCGACN